ncbi:MAG: lysine--tRNA ligase [bacterium]|nr:lysine--tRNA ligase [bacterium]
MAEIGERADRLVKLSQLIEKGIDPYPSHVTRTHSLRSCADDFSLLLESQQVVHIVGRVRSLRRHGGSTFLVLEDVSGRMQIFVRKDTIGEEQYVVLKDLVDMGDFLQVTGTLFLTKTEEKTVLASSFLLIAKALLPLPEQWHGLADVEIRYRQRYLDLLANEEVRDVFLKRATIIRVIRQFFEEKDFLEVETPVLQPIAGGATARPFVTHHNALDQDMFLRIAPELYLKRLVVGGLERVFEFARCFRNEGIDHTHNPEFTMLEAYMAYADYHDLMNLMQELFLRIVQEVYNRHSFENNGKDIVFPASFERMTFRDAIQTYAKVNIDTATDEQLVVISRELAISLEKNPTRAQLLDGLFKKCVVFAIVHPTFIIDYPVELSPLAKKMHNNPRYVERFQLIIAGMEFVNAFSELNDPQDQLERFMDQQKNRDKGDDEAHQVDMEYINALECGLPPTAGLGIGIDRLVALLTNSRSLKEVILFPTLRRKE